MSENITINEMDNYCKSFDNHVEIKPDGFDVPIRVKKHLSLSDELILVKRVVNAACSVGDDAMAYVYLDTAFDVSFIQMMTNINMPGKRDGVSGSGIKMIDIEKVKKWIDFCDLIHSICSDSDVKSLYCRMKDEATMAVDREIEMRGKRAIIRGIIDDAMDWIIKFGGVMEDDQEPVEDDSVIDAGSTEQVLPENENDREVDDIIGDIASAMYIKE